MGMLFKKEHRFQNKKIKKDYFQEMISVDGIFGGNQGGLKEAP
ncbi:MAG: hypothetical protein R2877_06695 [Bdellovibrionota bacterium]